MDDEQLRAVDASWRAANYLSVGQIYLSKNPLLREPLRPEHIKPRLLGHFGTVPGLNLMTAHINRAIGARELRSLFIAGPGHGGPAMVAGAWLDGGYTERFPDVTRDADGMRRLFAQFSAPGGVPSHAAPETPGSIHEGGELGYSLSHAYGAAFDNPDLTVFCAVGDGEAETAALATGWHGTSFLNPATDGAVLPILHLNEWKIAGPTVLARIPEPQLVSLLRGYGHEPVVVRITAEDAHLDAHRRFAEALDGALDRIADIQRRARAGETELPARPMIVLRSPKGWTAPSHLDGQPLEGTWRAHQVPLTEPRTSDDERRQLEQWLRSYRPEELFDADGAPTAVIDAVQPRGDLRLSMTPYANGGVLRRDLDLPDVAAFTVDVAEPGASDEQATAVLGTYFAEVIRQNPETFRIFGPDETASNKLAPAVYDATDRQWLAGRSARDEHLARAGRVIEVLSEHQCQGWLEGYLLTGRHGVFASYEAFAHIVDSMFNQHAKWLEASAGVPWRASISSFTYLLTSHVWQQDHNGFTHQDPGFLDVAANKSADVVRLYLPIDANTLLATFDHCLRSVDEINVVVAGKQDAPQWLSAADARRHVERGAGVLPWAGTDTAGAPDVVLACAGDVPTRETLAAAAILRAHAPSLAVRVVNVVDLMRLPPRDQHPHGLTDAAFDELFTVDRPVVFAFHGYPSLIHRLASRRHGHANLHVRGYLERGTTTTPFDMLMMNELDRYRLAMDAIERVPGASRRYAPLLDALAAARDRARAHTRAEGEDAPEVEQWRWPDGLSESLAWGSPQPS